jgi:hypothetical protein
MKTHLRYSDQTRTETDEAVVANLVRKGWEIYTPEIVPENPPAYTAEEWVAHDFGGTRSTTLLYLLMQIQAVGKSAPKLLSVRGWLDQMIAAGVTNPEERRSDWPAAPFSFKQASIEALEVLSA